MKSELEISAYVGGPLLTVGYLVYDHDGGSGMIVDTPLGTSKRFLELIESHELELRHIVNTHGHWDHIAENVILKNATGAVLCAHSWDMSRLANPAMTGTDDEPAVAVTPSRADRNLQDGAMLELGDYNFEVIHTPGHTPGSICLYERNAGVLFTGDTLYRDGVGETHYPGGNLVQLNESLRRLASLPDHTKVFPGHRLSTTIGRERWLLELKI